MKPETLEAFLEMVDETVILFTGMAEKIMRDQPAWEELPYLLSRDELAIFQAFTAWTSHHAEPKHWTPLDMGFRERGRSSTSQPSRELD
jgi:hypothetical protein